MSMSISGFNATQNLTSTQSTAGVNAAANRDSDGDNDGSRVSGTRGSRHQQGGGVFMQDALKALQEMGLNLPGVNTLSPTTAPNSTPPVSGTATTSSATSATSSDIGQALHTFLHDLRQALKQSGSAQQQTTTKDGDGGNDTSAPISSGTPTTGVQNGYSNFASNLNNLISSLSAANSLGANSTPNTISSTNSPSGSNTLQTDFANLVSALGGSSSTSTLQDFLSKMASNPNNTTQNGIGSIINKTI